MIKLAGWAAALALAVTGMTTASAWAKAEPPPAAGATAGKTAAPDYSWVDKLPHQSGAVALATAKAQLNLGDDYYYLGPDEAKRVLTEAWGNPPDAVHGVLGMIFPKKYSPIDNDAWGAVITYEDSGYVSDDDAAKIDAAKLLDNLRQGEADDNAARKKAGYDELHLVGWAEPPSYDAATHSAIWARQLSDVAKPGHDTLNYGIRILGRRGVLGLNIVAPMSSLPEVKAISGQVTRLAAYNPGERYADVDKKNDKMAAYGVAGLIAAGVGAVAVKKLGLLALILAFGKKAIVLVAAAGAWVASRFRGLFNKKKDPPAGSSGGGPQIIT